ncbi:YihY/virulence factor BrkB family protein [Paraburkholderia sp. SIMBA_050]|uniref:Membrane protein n=1 Tax=Paraburkholderia terricola TaxID=169427 RepID=A0A1M6NUF4_9BURK|nr:MULTISPECIES: YihY/virulence factor BrkB family protein [Paraburkholderia]AXE95755.1 YihY/virulence factor BrkB family protein [Paraburkholderia terricola]SDO19286.1 membrane protein [Paraburkholderia sediminicola]SHJ99369.1 membrane protein [Paraburkholderia terricola]
MTSRPLQFAHKPGGTRNLRGVALTALKRFSSDRCTTLAASIGFYSAFSLAPTLLIVLTVAGWFFGESAASGRLFAQVRDVMGKDAAMAMQTIVEHAHRASGGGLAALVSTGLLIVGASATFSSLNTALDVVFSARQRSGMAGLALLVRARLISVGLVLGVGFLLVVSLVLDAAIAYVGHRILGDSPLAVAAQIAQTVFGLLVLWAAFAALLRWLPDTRVRWTQALSGAAVSAVLFTVGRRLFGIYLAYAGTANSFGAAGSLAVLMMWLYFSAAVFLLGAEIAAAMGERRDPRDDRRNAKKPPGKVTGSAHE